MENITLKNLVFLSLTLVPILISGRLKGLGLTTIFGFDVTLFSLLVLTLSAVFISIAHSREPILRGIWPFLLFAVYVVVNFASFWNREFADTKILKFAFICVPAVCATTLIFSTKSFVAYWKYLWLISGSLLSFLTLFIFGNISVVDDRFKLGNETIGVAGLSSIAAILAIFGLSEGWLNRSLALVLLSLNVAAVIFIGSRGPFAALLFGFFFWLFTMKIKLYLKFLICLVLFVISNTILNLAPVVSSQRLSVRFLEESARPYLLNQAITLWVDNPVFGVGFGGFRNNVLTIHDYPHNLFAEIFAELGLVGMFFFLVLLGRLFMKSIVLYRNPSGRAAIAISVNCIVLQQFSSDLTNRIFWLSLVPLMCMVTKEKKPNLNL